MSIEVKEIKDGFAGLGKQFAIWNTYNNRFMDYEGLAFLEYRILNYLKKCPFPKDEEYSKEDMISDFTGAGGSVTMRCEKEETADWIAEMITQLI